MIRIVDRGIFQKANGYWWANSPTREGYEYSLRTRSREKAIAIYRKHIESHLQYIEEYERNRSSLWPTGHNEEGD